MDIKGKFSKNELVLLSSIAPSGYEKEEINGKDIGNISQLLRVADLNGVGISFAYFLRDQLQCSNGTIVPFYSTHSQRKLLYKFGWNSHN